MKGFTKVLYFAISLSMMLSVSCGDDEPTGSLKFDEEALFMSLSESRTVEFSASNISELSLYSKPEGWNDPIINLEKREITITAPDAIDLGDDANGSYIFKASISGSSNTFNTSLFAVVAQSVNISDDVANSYVINIPNAIYTIDGTLAGDGSTILNPASAKITWQSEKDLIEYLELNDAGEINFFVGGEEDNTTICKQGNALLSTYDSRGNLLWNYHLWVSDYALESVTLNGKEFMTYNLGASANSNADTEQILASQGLFYQWGRSEPSIGAQYYNAASGGVHASIYDGDGSVVYLTDIASTSSIGTLSYASENPLAYILGVEDSNYDWRWDDHSTPLWSSTKSPSDPCPYGWKVPSSADFASLTIKEPLNVGYETYQESYGWTLTDGTNELLFISAGRRLYNSGNVQNVYISPSMMTSRSPMPAQPWVGHYWTTDMGADAKSKSLYFYFDEMDVAASSVKNDVEYYRANGMSIRCVRE